MNHGFFKLLVGGITSVVLATWTGPAQATDLQDVVRALEERERSQNPVWFKYTLRYYMSPTMQGIAAGLKKPAGKDIRWENSVEYVIKGPLVLQKVNGPKHVGVDSLERRDWPSMYFFDGNKAVSFERPDYVRVASKPMEVLRLLHVKRPADLSNEAELLDCLRSVVKGETYDLVVFKEDEMIDGERLCRIEFRAKETKWLSRAWLYPDMSYAVKSKELIQPDNLTVYKFNEGKYQVIDGVAYLKSGKQVGYGGPANARYVAEEFVYEAQSIETDLRKIPDNLFEAKVDPRATYYDADLKTQVTSAEQVQAILDTIAGMSKVRGRPLVRWWVYAGVGVLVVAGLLVAVTTLRRRARRQPVG